MVTAPPSALLLQGCAGPLSDRFPLPLADGPEHVDYEAPRCGGRVQALGVGDERHAAARSGPGGAPRLSLPFFSLFFSVGCLGAPRIASRPTTAAGWVKSER